MSNQNQPNKNEISKPKVSHLTNVNRTLSAGYEVPTDGVENLLKEKAKESSQSTDNTDSSKKMKLNVTATAYIPKSKQQQTKTEPTTTSTTEPPKITIPPQQQKVFIPQNIPQQYGMINPNMPNMMMVNNPAFAYSRKNFFLPLERMPSPYMMQPGYGYSPIQGGNFFQQPIPMQTGFTPMYPPKNIQQPSMQTGGFQQPSTSTGGSKFSVDAPSFTPKKITSNTSQPKETPKETTTIVEPKEIAPVVEEKPTVTEVKKTETQPTVTQEERPQVQTAPIVKQTVEEPVVEKKEAPQTQQAPVTQQTQTQTKPAEQPVKKGGLSSLLGNKPAGTVIKSTPVVTQPTVTKPAPKKNTTEEKLKELEKKMKTTKNLEKKTSAPSTTTKPREAYSTSNYTEEQDYQETKVPEPEPEPEDKWEVVRYYFRVSDKKKEETKRKFDVDFLMKFKDWKISKENLLIEDLIKHHIEKMKDYQDEFPKKQTSKYGDKKGDRYGGKFQKQREREPEPQPAININTKDEAGFTRQSLAATTSSSQVTSIGAFARKNLDAENKMAEEFKTKLDEERKVDPIKDELKIHLNVLTLDNYKEIKQKIFDLIKGDIAHQEKLIDAIFEWTYVVIYSKLCYDLDKELPQRSEIDPSKIITTNTGVVKKPASTSIFRSKLLEKCKKVFKEELANFYVLCEDPEEKEQKMKQFTLGNVNFIGELINHKILTKKVVFQCVDHLFQNKSECINIEGVVILLDKFGTFINKDEKIKPDDLKQYNEQVNNHLETLNYIQENDKKLPGYIRYKIINLIDKRDRGWQESKNDLVKVIKSKNEVYEEYDQEMREKGEVRETTSTRKNVDYDKFRKLVGEDLEAWKTEDHKHFDWTNVEKMIKFGYSTFFKCYSEAIIDAIGRQDDIDNAYTYLKDVTDYYSNKMYKDDRADLISTALSCLEYLSDYSLDNHYLLDIWGKIVNLFVNHNLFIYRDLEKLSGLGDDQIECITTVVVKSVIEAGDERLIEGELLKLSFFKASKKLLNEKYAKLSGK